MKKRHNLYITFAIIVIGMCLRPSITGLGSVLRLVKTELALSDTASGMLTTIPLLTFAVVSPLVRRSNSKFGTANSITIAFLLIACGTWIRSYLGIIGLFVGTVMIGSGIAFGNVLLPAIIKKEFPLKYGFMTALNSVGLAVSSAIASGVNYPLSVEYGLGWKKTLCIYAIAAIVAILVWRPVSYVNIDSSQGDSKGNRMIKNPIAWSVTAFLGIEALAFYSCSAWLSTIFQAKGIDATTAGFYVSAFQLTGIPASFIIPTVAGMKKDQRTVAFSIIGAFLAGIVLMAVTDNPGVLMASALLAGFGCNGGFALSMAFIGFRTDNAADAMQLSGMSQSLGYVVAALGPIGMGWLHERLGSWNLNLWCLAGLLVILLGVSAVCAKDTVIEMN